MPVLFAKQIQNSPSPVYLTRDFPELPDVVKGYIPGELSFAANSRELEQTRANSARIRQQFADTYTPPNSGERSPEFGGVRSSSPGFARTPPRTGERFARKFVRGKKSQFPTTSESEERHVRRELSSPRTWFAANEVRRELSSPMANCSSPKGIIF